MLLKATLMYRPTMACLHWIGQRSWRPRALHFYSQFVTQGSLCFDIGANIGDRINIFRKLGAAVIAVEPQDDCIRRLRKAYSNDCDVKIVQKAVGPHEGSVIIHRNAAANGLSSCSPEWIKAVKSTGRFGGLAWDRNVEVPMTTLDTLITEFGSPDFCKIDVEGYEQEVIRGLSQPVKAISLEFTPEYLISAINSVHRLAGLGLTKFNYTVDESMKWALPNWVGENEICTILANEKLAGDIYGTI